MIVKLGDSVIFRNLDMAAMYLRRTIVISLAKFIRCVRTPNEVFKKYFHNS